MEFIIIYYNRFVPSNKKKQYINNIVPDRNAYLAVNVCIQPWLCKLLEKVFVRSFIRMYVCTCVR